MLITFIVTVAILAALYLAVNICNGKINRQKYDFITGAKKSTLILAHILFGISLLVIASEIIIYFFLENSTALWFVYVIFLIIAIIGFILISGLYFTYEAIIGDEVYIRRFFGVKKIKIIDIADIDYSLLRVIAFCDKYKTCLFFVDVNTQGIDEFISLIEERRENQSLQCDSSDEKETVLAELGREHRASYAVRRKKLIIGFAIFSVVFLLAIILSTVLLGANTVMIVVLALLSVLALVLGYFTSISALNKELNVDDVTLGNKIKFTNKRVKGASKNAFKTICISCICFMFFGAVLTFPLFIVFGDKENYDGYTSVTGKIEYTREQFGKSSYIAIGFYDMPTEYRLSSIFLDEFDYSFFDEVKAGDTVTVLVGNDKDREFSLRDVSKKQFNFFYYLATDDKEYFTYEDYVKSHADNDRVGFIIGIVGLAAFAASAVTLIIAYFVCKNREKNEDIVI